MELYNMLGKGIVSIFIGLTNLILPSSPPVSTPIPTSQISTSSYQIVVEKIEPIVITLATTSAKEVSTSKIDKPKTIPIYLNYPEKIVISPAKSIDVNFNKIFQYSLQTPSVQKNTPTAIVEPQRNVAPISLPTTANVNRDQKIKNSVVNIFCTIQNGRNVKVVTGSGVVVDPRGIILTNAHVGQFPLLQNSSIAQNMNCSVRTGSPVNKTYGVKALYISEDWISNNYRNISQTNFSETGEGDIALLYIVDKHTGAATGKTFDYLPLSSSVPQIGDQISIASYPADLLGRSGINALLTVQTEQLRVSDAFNFSYSSQSDLIETSDSLQAQHGSSGGALLDSNDSLAGIIVITVSGNNPLMKHARALTIPHISSTIQKDTGLSLLSFLRQDPEESSRHFDSSKSSLVNRLIDDSAALFFQQ